MSIITGRRLNYFYSKFRFVLGGENNTAGINNSVALGGIDNTASGERSAVLGGEVNTASGNSAVVLGGADNTASGETSAVLGGVDNKAIADFSAVLGYYNRARNFAAVALGKYNKDMATGGARNTQVGDLFVLGNGTGTSAFSNALRVTQKGEVYGTQAFKSSGADYAEHIKEWADGNPNGEDRVGYMVTIRNGLLHKANEGDYIAGITSGNPSVVGNADEDYYWKYERDMFNRIVMEDVPEMVQQTDENGNLMFDKKTREPIMIETGNMIKNARMKLADGYDSSLQENYVERKDRKEWDYVGMVGVIPVRDDGTCLPDHFCKCGIDGVATLATARDFDTFYVIERITDSIVSVELR